MSGNKDVNSVKTARKSGESTREKLPPVLSSEAREQQMIHLAVELAEKQLMEGTASSQVITHYLKLGSMRERLEREKLKKEVTMLEAKAESLKSAKRIEELFSEAISAFRGYAYKGGDDDDAPL